MGYGIYILSHSTEGVEDFIVTISQLLKEYVELTDVCFSFIHIGEFKSLVDLPKVNASIRSACNCEEVPDIHCVSIDSDGDHDCIAKLCHEMVKNGQSDHAVFVDLVSMPVLMTGICNRLFELVKSDGSDSVSRMIFYTYKKYVSGDGSRFNFSANGDDNTAWLGKRLLRVLGISDG